MSDIGPKRTLSDSRNSWVPGEVPNAKPRHFGSKRLHLRDEIHSYLGSLLPQLRKAAACMPKTVMWRNDEKKHEWPMSLREGVGLELRFFTGFVNDLSQPRPPTTEHLDG